MEGKDLNTQLFEKMNAEQGKFRDWLLTQSPEEILRNTYQYTVKEDILFSFDSLELTDEQAAALLSSPAPLDDVYKEFLKRETGYMDVIRDCVEERAKEVIKTREELRSLPVYKYPGEYARENGELDQYRASGRANRACKEAIETAISEHYRDNRLGPEAVHQVVEQFGFDRTMYVLANTIQQKDWDARFSHDNKAWAATIPVYEDKDGFGDDRRTSFVVNSHSGLTDLFVAQARKEQLLSQEKSKEAAHGKSVNKDRASVLDKLQKKTAAPKPPANGKKKAQER